MLVVGVGVGVVLAVGCFLKSVANFNFVTARRSFLNKGNLWYWYSHNLASCVTPRRMMYSYLSMDAMILTLQWRHCDGLLGTYVRGIRTRGVLLDQDIT